jgi:hypothetical protein
MTSQSWSPVDSEGGRKRNCNAKPATYAAAGNSREPGDHQNADTVPSLGAKVRPVPIAKAVVSTAGTAAVAASFTPSANS